MSESWTLAGIAIGGPAALAPMAGLTDSVFRGLCREQGAGLVFTELTRASLLLEGGRRSRRLCSTTPRDAPVAVQLYGTEPAELAAAAQWVVEHERPQFIDLNIGCPVARVVTRGAGAALMRQPDLVRRLVRAVVDAVPIPVTAKTRSGWSDREINAAEVGRAVQDGGGAALTVHARTREQRHDGPPDWELLAELKRDLQIPIIGNGGVSDGASALALRERSGVDAVMVGRASIGNPWIFDEIAHAWRGAPWTPPTPHQRRALLRRHADLAVEEMLRWAEGPAEAAQAERRGVAFIRGHLACYLGPGPAQRTLRPQLNRLDCREALFAAVDQVLT